MIFCKRYHPSWDMGQLFIIELAYECSWRKATVALPILAFTFGSVPTILYVNDLANICGAYHLVISFVCIKTDVSSL